MDETQTATRPQTVVYIATSLDGFIARPDGGIDWLDGPESEPDEDYGWFQFIADIDHIVMGRKTFEQVLTFDQWIYGNIPLTCLSSTLQSVPERLQGQVDISPLAPDALLRELAARGRGRVYVDGGQTIQGFLRADLIDELIITQLPVLIGQGIPLFGPLDADLTWQYLGTKTWPNGLVKNHYRRRR